ncbi:hypothetical protein KAX06_00060 [candidate division WOR-3 bacterium]|nr:hypothetical protein [candidate division WOR-3 bacterium]
MPQKATPQNKKTGKGKDKTSVLSPLDAVEMVWALTGKSSSEESTQTTAIEVETRLNYKLKSYDDAPDDHPEKRYLAGAKAAIESTRRSLDIIYKGRELNFEENAKLREETLNAIKETLSFGTKARDFLKSLPTMAITTAVGDFALIGVLDNLLSHRCPQYRTLIIVLFSLFAAGVGYLIYLGARRVARRMKEGFYITQDYERNRYYEQYLRRSVVALHSLYRRLEIVHKQVFGQEYLPDADVTFLIEGVIAGVGPTFCPYIQKHHWEKKITPGLWSMCETGNEEAKKQCPFWEGKRP